MAWQDYLRHDYFHCFSGTKRCPGQSVLNRLCSPHLLPQSPKVGAGRGGGGAVVSCKCWIGGPYCHADACSFCPFSKGEMLSVFLGGFSCLAQCLLHVFCRSSLLRVAVWKNLRERTFVFGCRCWSCVFWWCFAYVFALCFGGSLPKLFGKFSWCQVLCFGDFSLYLRFSVDVVFVCVFSRDKAQVVTGHPHTHLFSSVLVLLFARWFIALVWPCVLLLGVFPGCHSGPRAFLGFSWNLRGLSSLAPSEALFGREAAWVFLCFLCLVVVFPLMFCFDPSHVLLEGPPMARPTAGPGRSTSLPSPEWGPGGAPRGRRVGPLLVLLLSCFLCLVLGRRDPGALRQEPFVCRGCPFRVAPWALTRAFCSPPQVFFVFFTGPLGPRVRKWLCTQWHELHYQKFPPPPENPRFLCVEGGSAVRFFVWFLAPENAWRKPSSS